MLRVFNATARYVDQGGNKRPGAFAIYLEPWHADIYEFLDLRKNTGKEEQVCWCLTTCSHFDRLSYMLLMLWMDQNMIKCKALERTFRTWLSKYKYIRIGTDLEKLTLEKLPKMWWTKLLWGILLHRPGDMEKLYWVSWFPLAILPELREDNTIRGIFLIIF